MKFVVVCLMFLTIAGYTPGQSVQGVPAHSCSSQGPPGIPGRDGRDGTPGRDCPCGTNAPLSLHVVMRQLLHQQDEIHQLQTEMATQEQRFQVEIQLLRNESATKAQEVQAEMRQLQDEMVAKDQRIQALEQRDYIERCETGVLATNPYNVLATGSGYRYNYQTANFSRAFRTTPVVTIGLTVLDHAHTVTLRVQTDVTEKSTTGLTVRFGAWEDAKLYYARLSWMACA
ncbi:uncharacterized protein [Branchiostoma lanceolatum]|uniref:uncharacterized protein n=1 Tax=Branchiostoma lanceolatum TaxID=7740 RepID=UPI0034551073